VLRKSPLSQLWYKPDMLFSTPKVHIIIDFHCPLSSHSPEAVVATELFVDLLVDYLNAYGKHESVNLVYFYIFPCITINLESTANLRFMYTICLFCSLWCSNCWFILFNISYFGWIPGIFSYYDCLYPSVHTVVLLAAICFAFIIIMLTVAVLMQCEVTAIMLIFVRTLPFNFKCLLKVSLGGYNDKMRVLLNAILVQIANFEVKPNRFSALKVIRGSYYFRYCSLS